MQTKELSIKTSKLFWSVSFLALCVLWSCSRIAFHKDYEKIVSGQGLSNVEAKWYSKDKRFALLNKREGAAVHRFFDPNPDLNVATATVQFMPITPEGSPYHYQLDTQSGQVHYEFSYCQRTDVFKEYAGQIEFPPYTEGIVPRYLDQLGKPQRIIVFGYEQDELMEDYINSHKVRVIGGLIEQYCSVGKCRRQNEWSSRLILVAVNHKKYKFRGTHRLIDLKDKVDWKEVRAFLTNSRGVNEVAGVRYPAYRINGEIPADKALLFLGTHGHLFEGPEMQRIQTSCYKLYDLIWKNFGRSSIDKKWVEQLAYFARKYQKKYQTCLQYVKDSNINEDFKRHWFSVYFSGLFLMDDLGYTYNCRGSSWGRNSALRSGKRASALPKSLKYCKPSNLNKAFNSMVYYNKNLRQYGEPFYRYITYDDGVKGSHEKIYSWIRTDEKDRNCSSKEDQLKKKRDDEIFPKDINWQDLPQARKVK